MKHFLIVILFLSVLFSTEGRASDIRNFQVGEYIEGDSIPYRIVDETFELSFNELAGMLAGNEAYSMKRAEYLVENAYYGGSMSYNKYCSEIDSVVRILNRFIDDNNIRSYRTAPNFALFHFFTKPSPLNGNLKFTYDFDNPIGNEDCSVLFTSKVLASHKGQCASLPLLYKILCDELGGECALAYAPMHLYIKHRGEDGQWVNVELTHGGLVRDVFLMETLNISAEAVRNRIFMEALTEKENIALMLVQLARIYNYKYNSYDNFVEKCVETVLSVFPDNCDALVMKTAFLRSQAKQYMETYGLDDSYFLASVISEFNSIMNHLDSLGYSQPTREERDREIEEGRRLMESRN
ncbi:MAG: hypothetical protein K2L16_03080 [Muribaculaceae bacterium]|nr:hypothetical protein [Muribaculaceae bacterium]